MSTESPEATAAARPLKALLRKQPEIEEVDEEDTSPGSDQSDTTITAGTETPHVTEGESPESGSAEDLKTTSSSISPAAHKNNTHISPKIKQLTRSEALYEECASPPLDPLQSTASTCSTDSSSSGIGTKSLVSHIPATSGSCSGSSFRGRLEKDGSQSSEAGTSSSLSRDSSVDTPYKDSTGIDLEEFIKKTLNKTPKDRSMMIKLEVDLIKFIREPKHHYLKFPQMSSYDRMLVHRIAAYFGLDHNVDQTGKCVIVNKTQSTRIPDFSFQEHIINNGNEAKPKMLLKRGVGGSFDELQTRNLQKPSLDNTRAKSLEERKQLYEEVRSRIFTGDETPEGQPTGYAQEEGVSTMMKKMLRPQSLSSSKEDNPWSSTESSGYGTDNNSSRTRILVPKANSFGGTGNFAVSHMKSPMRGGSLSKADSLSMAGGSLQPSLGSPLVRPLMMSSSPVGSCSHSDISSVGSTCGMAGSQQMPLTTGSVQGQGQKVYWVASDPNTIPPGSIVINPQTGQPYLNPDGSHYRTAPGQPLPMGPQYPGSPQPQMYQQHSHDWTQQLSQDSQMSQELCQQMSVMKVTPQSSLDSCGAGDTSTTMQQQPVVVGQSLQQQYQQQGVYYSGTPNIPGQTTMRYMYNVPYPGAMSQQGYTSCVSSDSMTQGQPYPSQQHYCPYVQGYQGNQLYPMTSQTQMVAGQSGQACDTNYSCGYSNTSPVEGQAMGQNYVTYSQQQPGGMANQTQMYYTVQTPQSNPAQVQSYAYSGQPGVTTYQTNTPPSQNNPVNPNVQLTALSGQQPTVSMNSASLAGQQPSGGSLVSAAGSNGVPTQASGQFVSYPSHPTMVHAPQPFTPQPLPTGIRGPVTPQIYTPMQGVPMATGPTGAQPAHQFHPILFRHPNMQMPMHIHQQHQLQQQYTGQQQQQQQQLVMPSNKSPHMTPGHVTVSAKSVSCEGPLGLGKVENGSGENNDVIPGVPLEAHGASPSPCRQASNQGDSKSPYQSAPYRAQVQSVQFSHQQPNTTKSPSAPKPQRVKKSRSRDSQHGHPSPVTGTSMSKALEVCELTCPFKRDILDTVLHDLISEGATLRLVSSDRVLVHADFNTNNQTISPNTRVFAVFADADIAAHILQTHSSSSYKLQPADNISESLA